MDPTFLAASLTIETYHILYAFVNEPGVMRFIRDKLEFILWCLGIIQTPFDNPIYIRYNFKNTLRNMDINSLQIIMD
jgi:hypothetical protein